MRALARLDEALAARAEAQRAWLAGSRLPEPMLALARAERDLRTAQDRLDALRGGLKTVSLADDKSWGSH